MVGGTRFAISPSAPGGRVSLASRAAQGPALPGRPCEVVRRIGPPNRGTNAEKEAQENRWPRGECRDQAICKGLGRVSGWQVGGKEVPDASLPGRAMWHPAFYTGHSDLIGTLGFQRFQGGSRCKPELKSAIHGLLYKLGRFGPDSALRDIRV